MVELRRVILIKAYTILWANQVGNHVDVNPSGNIQVVQDWKEERVPGTQALNFIIPFSMAHFSNPYYLNVSNFDEKLSRNKSFGNKYLESLDNQDKISDDGFNWDKDYIKAADDHKDPATQSMHD